MPVSDISQWFRQTDGMSQWTLLPKLSACSSRSCVPLDRVFLFLHLCICIRAAQLELTFRLGPFDTDGYQIVLSESSHVRTSTGHTQGLIRGLHARWWVMFFLSPAGPESSVAVGQPEESGCVNGIKRDTMDWTLFAFVLSFCVLNGFRGQLSRMEKVLVCFIVDNWCCLRGLRL